MTDLFKTFLERAKRFTIVDYGLIKAVFLLLGIIRLVKIPKKETRLLYYFIFTLLIGVTSSEYAFNLWSDAKFDIFDIIASCCGLFLAAAIHNYFEIKGNQVPK